MLIKINPITSYFIIYLNLWWTFRESQNENNSEHEDHSMYSIHSIYFIQQIFTEHPPMCLPYAWLLVQRSGADEHHREADSEKEVRSLTGKETWPSYTLASHWMQQPMGRRCDLGQGSQQLSRSWLSKTFSPGGGSNEHRVHTIPSFRECKHHFTTYIIHKFPCASDLNL